MGHVYFIKAGEWLKVGYSASVYNRWIQHRSLETKRYGELAFIGCFEGSLKDEKAIHRVLGYQFERDRREWFKVSATFAIRQIIGDKPLLALTDIDGYHRSPESEEFSKLKVLPKSSAARYEAVRSYIKTHPGIIERIALRADVHRSVVSKVLHGKAVSAPVEQAIFIEEAA